MLLTITYRGTDTPNLGFLLHKNPYRAQSFDMNFGKGYVFYPEVSDTQTTMALLLDINPIDLARGKLGTSEGGLFDYVNDRPYVSSSFMSTALVRIFGTAMQGRCDKLQPLADTPLALTACVHMLPCRGEAELCREIFEPLGYTVAYQAYCLDEKFPEWGDSTYLDLTISGTVRLSDLLNHLYVLIPVFDRQKHYWVGSDEIDKLLYHGEGWLKDHPARERIVKRYFGKQRSYANRAIDRLLEAEPGDEETELAEDALDEASAPDPNREKRVSLNAQRLEHVKNAVIESGAKSVIDLGCGEGRLIAKLLDEKQLSRVTGTDVMIKALEKAKRYLRYDRMPPYRKQKLLLVQASLTYRDTRFSGYDCACIVEVVEHLDPRRIPAMERVVFEFAAPNTVIVTTPNKEYNAHYEWMKEDLRHGDHRFEWTRDEFAAWVKHVCDSFGYTAEINGIGELDEQYGMPTQMGVFTKCI